MSIRNIRRAQDCSWSKPSAMPCPAEVGAFHAVFCDIRDRIHAWQPTAVVRLIGSVAKGTVLSGHRELDIAVLATPQFDAKAVLACSRSLYTWLQRDRLRCTQHNEWICVIVGHFSVDIVVTASPPADVVPVFVSLPKADVMVLRPSLSVQQTDFVSRQHPWIKGAIMCLKSWVQKAQAGKCTASYFLEVSVIYALRPHKQRATAWAAKEALHWIIALPLDAVVRNSEDILPPADVVKADRPTILDPCDPTNNLSDTGVDVEWAKFVETLQLLVASEH